MSGWITAIVALIALVQPWVIAYYKKYIKKLEGSFLPSLQMKLFYNRSGSYLQVGGTIEAKNQAAVIKDISATIVRLIDKAEMKLDWSTFIIPVFQYIGGSSVTTNQFACPFKVEANGVNAVFVEMADSDQEEVLHLTEMYSILNAKINEICHDTQELNQARERFIELPEYKKYRDELVQKIYWRASEYVIELKFTYNENSSKVYKYKISINQEEANKFKENIEKSMMASLETFYGQAVNFYMAQKEYRVAK